MLLAVLVPVSGLMLLEGGLRLAGCGYPASFLVPGDDAGRPVWRENPFYAYHIFFPPLARVPSHIQVDREKPPGVFRVVVLGESAAQGDPMPPFGPARVLEYLLRERDPQARVEVINAALTAVNSHVITDIARDVARLQPDAVILYIGNNEVIGPYGPGTVFSGYFDSDRLIRLFGWFEKTRLGQVLRLGAALAAESGRQVTFDGLSMFVNKPVPRDDPRLAAVYRRYEQNLSAIMRQVQRAGARVILSTVAVNLSDCPPSLSVNRRDLSAADRTSWQASFNQGWAAARAGNWAEALDCFERARAVDDQPADLQYGMGLAQRALGRREEAEASFGRAMDQDAFRYRTDSAMNEIVRRLAGSSEGSVELVDAAALFRDHPTYEDRDLFIDHVHFSFAGAALLARAWADRLMPAQAGAEDEEARLREVLMFTPLSEIAAIQEMLNRFNRPPFNQQVDIAQRRAAYQQRIQALTTGVREAEDPSGPAYRDRVDRFPADVYFPVHHAQYLVTLNRFREARAVLDPLVQRRPTLRSARALLALLEAREDRAAAAAGILLGHEEKQGFFAAVETGELMKTLAREGQYAAAAALGREVEQRVRALDYRWRIGADTRRMEEGRDLYERAVREMAMGDLAGAEADFARLVQQEPEWGDPLFWLAVIQGHKGRPDQGFLLLQQALQRMDFARAYYHAALWEAKGGPPDAVRELLAQAMRHARDDAELVNSLAWLLIAHPRPELRDPEQARLLLEGYGQRGSALPARLQDTLAAARAAAGQWDDAVALSLRAEARAGEEGDEALLRDIKARRILHQAGRTSGWSESNQPLHYF